MIAYGFSAGAQILIARYDGEKRSDMIGKVTDHTLLIMLFTSLIMLFVSWLGIDWFLLHFVQSPLIRAASKEFLTFRILGFPAMFLLCGYRAFFTGIAQTKAVSYMTVIMAIANVVFNYLLVFGNGGFPRLEIAGSAMASVISEWMAFLFIVAYTHFAEEKTTYALYTIRKADRELLKEIVTISIPVMMQFFISLVSWFFFFLIIEKISERALAISNLARNVYMILMLSILAFSQSASTIVSNLIGQGKGREVLKTVKRICLFSAATTLLINLFNIIEPELFYGIFTSDKTLIRDSLPTNYVINFTLILFSLALPLLSAVSGTGYTKVSFVIEFVTMFAYLGLSYYLAVALKAKVETVWMTEILYFSMIGGCALVFLLYHRKKILHETSR